MKTEEQIKELDFTTWLSPSPLGVKKGMSWERGVCVGYQAFAFVIGDLIFCQLSLCVQWQESIGWWTDCWTSVLFDVSQVVWDNDYGSA